MGKQGNHDLRDLRLELKKGRGVLIDRLGVKIADARDGGKVDEVRKAKAKLQEMRTRLKRCKTAGDVFSEFSKDAALGKVMEMSFASDSGDRQRAQETILDRSLGKVVDRIMSVNVEVANMSDEELDRTILELTNGQGGERKTLPIIADAQEIERIEPIEGDKAASGVSGEVREVESAGEGDLRGEQKR